MTDRSRFDYDPEALAWARAKVQAEIDRAEKFVADDTPSHPTHLVRALAVARVLTPPT